MTLQEIRDYFGGAYLFSKKTGMSDSNYTRWKQRGYVPYFSQLRIERLTKGFLKADLNHAGRDYDRR